MRVSILANPERAGTGQVAITPGDSYFGGSPPDEKIFHPLAELRIFLAREVFRQVVPVEKASAGLNESDMLLRRELKLNYLGTIMSLTLDHDPAILDGIALDVELYGKPFAVASGHLMWLMTSIAKRWRSWWTSA